MVNRSSPLNRPLCTSDSDPIRVDFLPQSVTRLGGKIGLTLAPGKCNIGMVAHWQRNLNQDLTRLRYHHGTDVLVTLLEVHEFAQLQIESLFEQIEALGMRSHWFPIPDFNVPASLPDLATLVHEIIALANAGQTVVIHCKAGLGRSGLVAAACLVALGYSKNEALGHVRQARPGTVETLSQENFVEAFAQAYSKL